MLFKTRYMTSLLHIHMILFCLCTIIVAIYLGKWVIKFVSSRLDRFASHYIPHPESLLKKMFLVFNRIFLYLSIWPHMYTDTCKLVEAAAVDGSQSSSNQLYSKLIPSNKKYHTKIIEIWVGLYMLKLATVLWVSFSWTKGSEKVIF